jgi:hypothetical protein
MKSAKRPSRAHIAAVGRGCFNADAAAICDVRCWALVAWPGCNGPVKDGHIVALYHRLTSYGPELDFPAEPVEHPLVLQDFVANDVARWPPQYKRNGVGRRLP